MGPASRRAGIRAGRAVWAFALLLPLAAAPASLAEPAGAEPEADPAAPLETPFLGVDGEVRAVFRPEFRDAFLLFEDLALFAIEGLRVELVGPHVAAPNPADPPVPSRILLAGPPELVSYGRRILGYLDVPQACVVVSLLATEVRCDHLSEMGGNVSFDRVGGDGPNTVFRGLFSEFEPESYLRSSLTQRRPWQGTSIGFGNVGQDVLENGAFEIVLRMLAHERRAEFLAWPTLVCTEGEPGVISSVAHAWQAVTTESSQTTLTVQPQPMETGIQFEVLPLKIGTDAAVLDLIADLKFALPEQEDGSAAGDVVVHRRRVQTRITIRDQESLLIGGLKIRRKARGTRGLPVLKGIPGLSAMSKDCLTTELVLLVKARIIVPDRGAGLFMPPGEARRENANGRARAAAEARERAASGPGGGAPCSARRCSTARRSRWCRMPPTATNPTVPSRSITSIVGRPRTG